MKKIILSLQFLLIFFVIGCYEDKGNYDYKDIQSFEIDFGDFKGDGLVMGDTIDIKPVFKGKSEIDETHLTYKWTLNDKTKEGWDQKNMFWITNEIMKYSTLVLEVTDTRNGMVYMSSARIAVASPYDNTGWMVLSEKNGKSVLSLVAYKETEWTPDYSQVLVKELKVYHDVYALENNGESMGNNPIGFYEHFCDDPTTKGQFIVFQDNSVDVNGQTFKKEINLSDAFVDGAYPSGVKIVNGFFMDYLDLITDQNGKIYTRIKSTDKLFHSNYFLPSPIKFEGEVLEECEPIIAPGANSKYVLLHDANKGRMLVMMDGDIAYGDDKMRNAGKIIALDEVSDAPENFVQLNNLDGYEVVSIQYWRQCDNSYLMLLKNKETGKYLLQSFDLDRSYGSIILNIKNTQVFDLGTLEEKPSIMTVPPYDNSYYVFFSIKNKLYLYDRENPNLGLKLYYEFPSNIASMNAETYRNRHMAVALEDGKFYLMNIVNAKNLEMDKRVMIKTNDDDDLGHIIKVFCKIGHGNDWS